MNEPVTRATVEAFYKAYAERDPDKIGHFLADDVEWTISGPIEVLPFCGTRHGKAAVIDMMTRLVPEVFCVFRFVPDAMLVDGDQAAMLSRLSGKSSEGRIINYRVAHFIHFRAGKIIRNLTLIDSFDAVEQVLGHPLDLHEGERRDYPDLIAV